MTPAKHPGFLSFGSVSLYTQISPSSPYFIFDLVFRSRLGGVTFYNLSKKIYDKMADRIPELTVENVIYWYWDCDPHWPSIDIANYVNCHPSIVYKFMHRNNIPVRTHSQAIKERWKCPFKKRIRKHKLV